MKHIIHSKNIRIIVTAFVLFAGGYYINILQHSLPTNSTYGLVDDAKADFPPPPTGLCK